MIARQVIECSECLIGKFTFTFLQHADLDTAMGHMHGENAMKYVNEIRIHMKTFPPLGPLNHHNYQKPYQGRCDPDRDCKSRDSLVRNP